MVLLDHILKIEFCFAQFQLEGFLEIIRYVLFPFFDFYYILYSIFYIIFRLKPSFAGLYLGIFHGEVFFSHKFFSWGDFFEEKFSNLLHLDYKIKEKLVRPLFSSAFISVAKLKWINIGATGGKFKILTTSF